MNDTTKSLKPWVTFAGCVLVVMVLYWAHAIFVPFALAILLDIRLDAAGHLARALGWARPVRPRGGDAGIHRAGAGGLGRGATDGEPVQGSARVPPEPPSEDPGRARCRQGRHGREAAGNDRGHQDGPGNAGAVQALRLAIRGGHLGRGRGIHRFCLARSDPRTVGNRRARARDGHLHAARATGFARPPDWTDRARPIGRHHEGV